MQGDGIRNEQRRGYLCVLLARINLAYTTRRPLSQDLYIIEVAVAASCLATCPLGETKHGARVPFCLPE